MKSHRYHTHKLGRKVVCCLSYEDEYFANVFALLLVMFTCHMFQYRRCDRPDERKLHIVLAAILPPKTTSSDTYKLMACVNEKSWNFTGRPKKKPLLKPFITPDKLHRSRELYETVGNFGYTLADMPASLSHPRLSFLSWFICAQFAVVFTVVVLLFSLSLCKAISTIYAIHNAHTRRTTCLSDAYERRCFFIRKLPNQCLCSLKFPCFGELLNTTTNNIGDFFVHSIEIIIIV